MLTFLDVVQKESFRESVLKRLRAGISDPAFTFPERFPASISIVAFLNMLLMILLIIV